MGFWKVLGGVAGGVGLIAALPVAGAVGVVTLAGAAVAGTVGGVAGAVASSKEKAERESARDQGERRATAKYELTVQKLVASLQSAEKQLNDDKSYFTLLVAMFAVGMATAAADGEVSAVEEAELEEFIAGLAHTNLPSHVKGAITRLRNNPPNFATAMTHVQKTGNIDRKLFEEVIELVALSDGHFCDDERALLEAFREAA